MDGRWRIKEIPSYYQKEQIHMRINLKKITLLIIILCMLFSMTACDSQEFVVSNNDAQIVSGIESFLNRGSVSGVQITIKNQCDLDNKKIVSFSTNKGSTGIAELLIMDDGSKVKVLGAGFGSDTVKCRLYKTDKAKHLVVTCGEHRLKIQYIKAEYEGKKYTFDVNRESYYIGSYIVPDNSKEDFCSDYKCYDENNKEIKGGI